MILCEINAVQTETDQKMPCYLADECSSRYDNLYSKRNSRSSSTRSTTVEYQVAHREGELVVKGADTRTASAGKEAILSASLALFFVFRCPFLFCVLWSSNSCAYDGVRKLDEAGLGGGTVEGTG